MLGAPSCGHVLDRGVVHTHIDVGCALTARGEQVTSEAEFVAHVHRGKKIQKVMLLTTGRERHTHRRSPVRRRSRGRIGYTAGRAPAAGRADTQPRRAPGAVPAR